VKIQFINNDIMKHFFFKQF